MNPEPNYFYLNIDNRWPGFELKNLEIAPDGALQLRALPRLVGSLPGNLSDLPIPQSSEPLAGLARADDGSLFFTDPERHRLWRIDPCDPAETPEPAPCLGGEGRQAGQFKSPRGLLYLPGRGLLVADSGNHRLQLIDLLTAQVGDIWDGYDDEGNPLLNEPLALAADSEGYIYVVVAGDRSLRKIDRLGRIDATFRDNIQSQDVLDEPVAVAIAEIEGEERVLVLDRTSCSVVIYSREGQWQRTFVVEELQEPLAMAVSGRAIYIGDNGDDHQTVLQFDLPRLADEQLNLVGKAVDYQGPIAALFIDRARPTSTPRWPPLIPPQRGGGGGDEKPGDLLLLPGQGLRPIVLQEGTGYETCGFALAGPFDFRQRPVNWHRLQALAEALPPHAHVRFFFRLSESPAPPPPLSPPVGGMKGGGEGTSPPWNEPEEEGPAIFDPCCNLTDVLDNWCAFPLDVTDGLFSSAQRPAALGGCGGVFEDPLRATYLWVGLMLSGDGAATPRFHQIQVQFDHESYLPHLPALYVEDKASRQFLLPLLSLFESFYAGHEAAVADLAALFDPAAAPEEYLAWLGGWLAQDLQEAWPEERKREMIAEAFAAYAWRGTPAGLRRRLHTFSGVRAHILEPLLQTDLWSLGETSTLGFDTRLASAHPQGAVLGSTATLDQAHLITNEQFGEPLFAEVAHQFVVQVYRGEVNTPEKEAEVRQVIERDKPAHTDYHLCFIEPRMRVGFQARVGIDTVVAGPPEALSLDEELGQRSSLGRSPASRIGEHSQVGVSTRI